MSVSSTLELCLQGGPERAILVYIGSSLGAAATCPDDRAAEDEARSFVALAATRSVTFASQSSSESCDLSEVNHGALRSRFVPFTEATENIWYASCHFAIVARTTGGATICACRQGILARVSDFDAGRHGWCYEL